jgi:hypothetical protein
VRTSSAAAMAATFGLGGLLNATNSSDSCNELRESIKEAERESFLRAARESAENWADTTSAVSRTSIVLDCLILCAFMLLRRHRPIQRAGLGFLASLLVGCIFGHWASLMDGEQPSGSLCRGRLALIYLFLYGMLAPLVGKLVSLCRAARNIGIGGNSSGWDKTAWRVTVGLQALQLLMLIFYLGITAGKVSRPVSHRPE